MSYSIKLYEYDHFYKQYEDYKNNLFFIEIDDIIECWMSENIKGDYDVCCSDYYDNGGNDVDYIYITFVEDADAVAFKLRWEI